MHCLLPISGVLQRPDTLWCIRLETATTSGYFVAPRRSTHFVPARAWSGVFRSTSYTNHAEVEALKEVLLSLLRWEDVRPEDVGVITPYAAQARAIRKLLGCPPPGKRLVTAQGVAAVEVSSVDGFQGREKDRVAMCPALWPPLY